MSLQFWKFKATEYVCLYHAFSINTCWIFNWYLHRFPDIQHPFLTGQCVTHTGLYTLHREFHVASGLAVYFCTQLFRYSSKKVVNNLQCHYLCFVLLILQKSLIILVPDASKSFNTNDISMCNAESPTKACGILLNYSQAYPLRVRYELVQKLCKSKYIFPRSCRRFNTLHSLRIFLWERLHACRNLSLHHQYVSF